MIVGAGPAGAAAAYWAAQAGQDALAVDMAPVTPQGRDKTCGDGLTPRAVRELGHMGALHILDSCPQIRGLKLRGFGSTVTLPWPQEASMPARGSVLMRTHFDRAVLNHALAAGARFLGGVKVHDAHFSAPRQLHELYGRDTTGAPVVLRARHFILAEGARSSIARTCGVAWQRGIVHGVAARCYVDTPLADDPWIHSDIELTDRHGKIQPGYGWVFPLGTADGTAQGKANVGCGALATQARPARVNTKKLLAHYLQQISPQWHAGSAHAVSSALLPMGGAVSTVAGRNWAVIGDAAALVNPLTGEGIDYALESARMLVEILPDAARHPDGLRFLWPQVLRHEFGTAFSLARRLALLLTMPGLVSAVGPLGMRGPFALSVMGAAVRLMGNLLTPQDMDVVARLWRAAGQLSRGVDRLYAADSRPLFGLPLH